MMRDIVTREQSLAALRRQLAVDADGTRGPGAPRKKLRPGALEEFIKRMRVDTDARKRHLADLQEAIFREERADARARTGGGDFGSAPARPDDDAAAFGAMRALV